MNGEFSGPAFMLSPKAKYAIKALLVLARAQDNDLLVQAPEISSTQNIPKKFLDLIFFELRPLCRAAMFRAGDRNADPGPTGPTSLRWRAGPPSGHRPLHHAPQRNRGPDLVPPCIRWCKRPAHR